MFCQQFQMVFQDIYLMWWVFWIQFVFTTYTEEFNSARGYVSIEHFQCIVIVLLYFAGLNQNKWKKPSGENKWFWILSFLFRLDFEGWNFKIIWLFIYWLISFSGYLFFMNMRVMFLKNLLRESKVFIVLF